jgi:hypothetical protein
VQQAMGVPVQQVEGSMGALVREREREQQAKRQARAASLGRVREPVRQITGSKSSGKPVPVRVRQAYAGEGSRAASCGAHGAANRACKRVQQIERQACSKSVPLDETTRNVYNSPILR